MNEYDRSQLLEQITKALSEQRLKELCFHLGVDYEELPKGGGKRDRVRELILHMERRNRIDDLIETYKKLRPHTKWPDSRPILSGAPKDILPEPKLANRWTVGAYVGFAVILLVGITSLVRAYMPPAKTEELAATPSKVPDTVSQATTLSNDTANPLESTPIAGTLDPVCGAGIAPALSELDHMVLITGTAFIMGDNQGNRPQHEVIVEDFQIDQYEVTNLQYQQFLSDTGHSPPPDWDGLNFPPEQTAWQPIVQVSWFDAFEYCKWLGKRLPTEAEWELACRGPEGNLFPWGDTPDARRANSLENACGRADTVGSHSPDGDSFYGVADLVGNVFEWVDNTYTPYPYTRDSENHSREINNLADDTAKRVLRSGSWQARQTQGSCTVRSPIDPLFVFDDVGFRCAQSVARP